MGELTVTSFVTLDGVMQAPGAPKEDTSGGFAWGGWVFPLADADMGATMVGIFDKAGAFLLGRGTYDIFAAHWPRVTDPDDPVASKLNALPKHVATRGTKTLSWANARAVHDVVAAVPRLKAETDGELQVHGSPGLIQTLLAEDLVDELRTIVFPVTIGHGKRLFGAGAKPASFELVSSNATSKGAIVAVHRRAGPLKTGSFALD
ncbi:MAG: dihydrofolate reductase family protein [Hyphomicrobiales bacterium]|nr:dihydrofolate reductase family protein [Hyphomicrobiales bacterium]MDE2016603.1 dihydrofolate reductase family protein [Hyphomicrobiales bacterium]